MLYLFFHFHTLKFSMFIDIEVHRNNILGKQKEDNISTRKLPFVAYFYTSKSNLFYSYYQSKANLFLLFYAYEIRLFSIS